jgi:hypothetical protein
LRGAALGARKKEDTGFKGSVSSGGEKMRRTRVAFYVTYLIIPQLSDPSTGNFATSESSRTVVFRCLFWFFQSADGSAKLH